MRELKTNVDVGGVLHTGRELHIRESVRLPEYASYAFPDPIDVALRLRRVGRGLELKGAFSGEASGVCARCLDDVRFPFHIAVDEQFDPTGEGDHPLGESNVLVGDDLDILDLVRQLTDSALPIVLLCDEQCPGLCAACGRKHDDGSRCTHPEQ
ncbi:MAG: hypothetical protein NVS2B3_10580 [Vulcanimicrobiaceae bacterium]